MTTTIGSLDINAFNDLYSDSNQYFWFESDSSATHGAGAHVTLVPDTTFISNPTGQNILMNTDGFSIRNGLLPMMTLGRDSLDFNIVDTVGNTYTNASSFGISSRIGLTDGSRVIINNDSIEMYTEEGNKAFQVLIPTGTKTEHQEVTKVYSATTYRVLKNGVTTANTTTTNTFTIADLDDVETSGEYSYFTLSGSCVVTIASHSQNGTSTQATSDYLAFKAIVINTGATRQDGYSFTFTKNGTQQTDSKSFAFSWSSYVDFTGTVTVTYNGIKTFTVTLVVKKRQSQYINTTVNAYTSITQLVCTMADIPTPETDIFGNVYLNASNFGDTFVGGDIFCDGEIEDGNGNRLSDFVGFETGTATAGSVTWKYRKWANGTLEMWGSGLTKLNINTAVGNIYTTAGEYDIAIPSFVDSVDFVTGELSGGGWVDVTGFGVPPKMRLYAPTAYTSTNRHLRYYLKGTWS